MCQVHQKDLFVAAFSKLLSKSYKLNVCTDSSTIKGHMGLNQDYQMNASVNIYVVGLACIGESSSKLVSVYISFITELMAR